MQDKVSTQPEQNEAIQHEAEKVGCHNGGLPIYNQHGVLVSTANFSQEEKIDHAFWWSYHERAQVALAVAQMYPGGDYLEFGSDGMGTFRNFLSAFDLHGTQHRFPDTKFLAFDIFGNVNHRQVSENEKEYFAGWVGASKLEEAKSWVQQHGLFEDKCEIHAGFFEDTLPPLLSRYQGDNKVGFAFLDCNITESYRYLFSVLPEIIHPEGYVYMDEYYINLDVPHLFRSFLEDLKSQHGVRGAEFIRSAGAFGALFRLSGTDYPFSSLKE